MSREIKNTYSIHEICNSIKNQELILPDIQRKFVWDERKIICLFDSIMRGYPINTLMFWELDTRDVTYAETIGKRVRRLRCLIMGMKATNISAMRRLRTLF